MLTSGVAQRAALDLDFEDDAESTVHVIIHDLKPPFLDGKTVYTKQLDTINPIRDPTSDIAIFSRKGSALVREKREQAERAKAAAKLASLGGTALGNIMGVKDEEAEAAAEGTPVCSSVWDCQANNGPFRKRRRMLQQGLKITRATQSLHLISRPTRQRALLRVREPLRSSENIYQHLLVAKILCERFETTKVSVLLLIYAPNADDAASRGSCGRGRRDWVGQNNTALPIPL